MKKMMDLSKSVDDRYGLYYGESVSGVVQRLFIIRLSDGEHCTVVNDLPTFNVPLELMDYLETAIPIVAMRYLDGILDGECKLVVYSTDKYTISKNVLEACLEVVDVEDHRLVLLQGRDFNHVKCLLADGNVDVDGILEGYFKEDKL